MIDPLDRQILHALHLDARIGYARLGAVLDISEQTVARRYLRLRAEGVVRVFGLTAPLGGAVDWTVRLGCRPGSAPAMATALARRPDVHWVVTAAGGSELILIVRGPSETAAQSPADQARGDLLHRLPQAGNVLSMSAHLALHRFPGRGEQDWVGLDHPLTPEQRAAVLTERGRPADTRSDPDPDAEVLPSDQPLLDALYRDGRAGYAAVAGQIGWSQRQVARRIGELTETGALYFDVDVAMALVGFQSSAALWLTVEPARLHAAGEAMSGHLEVPFVAAMTGQQNLHASLACRDTAALYRYLTTTLAAVEGVRQMEISPVQTRYKQAGSLMEHGRVVDPPDYRAAA